MFDSEVFPLYEVAEFPVDHFAVQDLFHHPFLFSVDNLREWLRGCTPSGYRIFWCWGEFYHIEDGVDAFHGCRKLEMVHAVAHLPLDQEWAQMLVQ